jgi:membrane-bound serine protease (ClpP class)
LVTELCLPGFGIGGCTGAVCFVAVIIMQFLTNSPTAATLISTVMAAVIILLVVMFVRSINKGALFRSPIVLKDKIDSEATNVSEEMENVLVGQEGIVETTLRPSGTVLINGKRYIVKAQASFIEKGTKVKVVAANGLDIVVE